jgi:hypothetical protein
MLIFFEFLNSGIGWWRLSGVLRKIIVDLLSTEKMFSVDFGSEFSEFQGFHDEFKF